MGSHDSHGFTPNTQYPFLISLVKCRQSKWLLSAGRGDENYFLDEPCIAIVKPYSSGWCSRGNGWNGYHLTARWSRWSLQVSFSECGMALSQLQICNGQGPRGDDIFTQIDKNEWDGHGFRYEMIQMMTWWLSTITFRCILRLSGV